MYNKGFKLIATAVGLVAVLVLVLAMPGATQQPQPLPTRNQIVQGLSQLVSATLTASEGDILDVENAVFASDSNVTWSYIRLHAASRSAQLLHAWIIDEKPFGDYLNLGALYLENDAPNCPPGYDLLKAGIYHLKVTKDLKLIAVDAMGNEFTVGRVSVERPAMSHDTVAMFPWKLIIFICVVSDPKLFCHTVTVCQPAPGGVGPPQCWTEQRCVGC